MPKKIAAPAKKLDPIKAKLLEAPVKTGEVLTIYVEGDYPTRYNEASAICKSAEKLMADLKPYMSPDALSKIFEHNAEKPFEPISSVAFQDENGNVTRISFTGKYGDLTAQEAEELFGSLKTKHGTTANVNDYAARTVTAKFDSSVFQDEEGRFNHERYDKIVGALDKVCQELGIKNPLSTSISVKPLPAFHTRRWVDFDRAANVKITKVLKNTISFTPCANAVTGVMCGEELKEKGEK